MKKRGESIINSLKVNFCGFWGSFNKTNNLFYNILSKHFNVEISDYPDFVICSNRGKPFEYMQYDCPRIMFMGENLSPDFTVFDYVIGFDYLEFGDRYFRLPFAFYSDNAEPWVPERITKKNAWELLNKKKYFCNFIYGHQSSLGMREKLFQELNKYKPVVSPGRYLNNMNTNGCSWLEKRKYLGLSKFTIAGDSIVYPGFFTEKIIQPFEHHSIPIYFGNPRINEDMNEKAFIWCKSTDDSDIQKTIERVKYLNEHDEAYIEMLMEYPLLSEDFLKKKYYALENFILNIFSQNRDKAFRRVRYFCADLHESYLSEYMKKHNKDKLIVRLKKLFNR